MRPIQIGRRTSLTLICFLSLGALAGCTSTSKHFGIVFISSQGVSNYATDIYRIPDNTQSLIEQLTFTPNVGEYHLLVSKNADRIIFEAGSTGSKQEPSEPTAEEPGHIYLLDTASKKLEDVTDTFSVPPRLMPMEPTDWSLDQRRFAVITYAEGLGTMDFGGTGKKDIPLPTVGSAPPIIHDAKWSPDGRKLILEFGHVLTDLQPNGRGLVVYDLENGILRRQLTDYREGCVLPKWSPTSQQIVATCFPPTEEVGGAATVRIFDTEESGKPYERLILSSCRDPSWSPDGKQIALVCDKNASQEGLFIINSDGNGIHEVKLGNLGNPAVVRYPTWSPDGTQIIYVAGTDSGHENIYLVNLDGAKNRALTQQVAGYEVVSVYPLP